MMKFVYKYIHTFIFVFIAAGLMVRNFKLRSVPFMNWDEGIYAQVAWEILQNRSLVTTFNDTVWLNKPPLIHSLIAGVFAFLGRSEFWARSLMIFFAMLLLFLLYKLSKKLLLHFFAKELDKKASLSEFIYLAPILVLASTPLFIERATYLNTDIALAVGWVGYFLYREHYWLKLVFLTLGTFSKSFLGLYPLLLEILLLSKSSFSPQKILRSLLLVIVALSWHIVSFIMFGHYFIQAHVADQVVKRVISPIELHFGGTYFYPRLLIENMGAFLLFLFISYIFVAPKVLQRLKSTDGRTSVTFWFFLVLLSPLPFFILLTIMKSKIPWYLATVLPLFSIAIGYALMQIKEISLRKLSLMFIGVFFLFQFIPQTYLLKPDYEISARKKIAKCISREKGEKIAFLVDSGERDVRNVLEAANLQTTTSFLYGGSPSFVFYSQKKVEFFYGLEQFSASYREYPILILTDQDYQTDPHFEEIGTRYKRSDCSQDDWNVFVE